MLHKIICPICQYQEEGFKTLESDCIFIPIEGLDQHLIRYQCPNCDVIFGTQQMLGLSKYELKNAYQKLFDSGHKDGDENSVKCEINNLLILNPNSNRVYLNWGAGTSVASDKAKLLGFTLLNFDPFVIDSSKYISKDQLKNTKFDGIISHNVLEHLQDPISELELMKSFLKPEASMIHSTPCYRYSYEYTKYHLFFFEGRSLDVICEKTKLTYKYMDSFMGTYVVKYDIKKE
jgi:hypothetical protein